MSIAIKTKQFRDDNNLTQEELAEKIGGVTLDFVSKVELGYKVPGTETAIRWAKVMDTTVEELFK